jgi:AbrB family looped-hinge helix DNA binding protein
VTAPMVERVRVDAENRIEIPADARERLGIGSGSALLVEVRDGALIARLDPVDYVARLGELNAEVWQDEAPEAFFRREREAWRD